MQDPKTDAPIDPKDSVEIPVEFNVEAKAEPIVEPKVEITEINKDLTDGSQRYPDVFIEHKADEIVHFSRKENHFVFKCKNSVALHIDVLNERTFRIRYSYNGIFQKDFSYAIDPKFKPAEIIAQHSEDKNAYSIRTNSLTCHIAKENLELTFSDANGKILNADKEGYSAKTTILKGVDKVRVSKKAPKGECFMGLGDKSGKSNLRGQKLMNWNTDSFAYGHDTDPLYRTIPFYYGLNDGEAYGIFFDNSYRTHFDFDSEENGTCHFYADGGEMNYYFFYGPTCTEVAQAYTQLTGTPELPPMWSLGFHQCRWSYYPEKVVRDLASEFRTRNIPCDAIYLDIDYMDEYRCFTWNYKHFPNPKKLIQDLNEDGFKTVVMIDPGIKVDDNYFVFADGQENDVFCKRPDGDLMTGPVWPPACAFPDYTKEAVREWWGPLYKGLYSEQGVSGFWNDMNEPAVFEVDSKTFPENVRHDYDGHPCSHAKAHNIYGMQMARATYQGLKNLKEDTRPFVLTRATYSGGQRFSSVWTGDNIASWEHLQIANLQCQRLSISGFSFTGTDIGGFVGIPTGELMVRWLQLGVFHPLFRVHSMGNNEDGATSVDEEVVKESEKKKKIDQEPWAFGTTYTEQSKAAIEWRYQLLPYLYNAFWEYTQTGKPMINPVSFIYQNDPKTYQEERDFIFGEHLLVSPVIEEGITEQKIYLPKGDWYELKTGKLFTGEQTITRKISLDYIPTFIKAGAVLPLYPVRQNTSESVDELTLKVFYNKGNLTSQLYEDQGEGYQYEENNFSLKTFETSGHTQGFRLTQSKKGDRADSYQTCKLYFHGLPFVPNQCMVDGKTETFTIENMDGIPVYVLILKPDFKTLEFSGTTSSNN